MSKHTLVALTFLLVTPVVALAAYNDVTLTTSTIISIGGYSLNVSGSSATIQSLTVNTNTFSAVLLSGSSISVSSATLQKLDYSSDLIVTESLSCSSSASTLTLTYHSNAGGAATTVTITPQSAACTTAAAAATTASNGSPGGGGGGGGSGAYTPTVTTPTSTIATVPATRASGLSSTQIDAIISLLQSFGADQSVINNVRASLTGGSAVGPSSSGQYTFTRRLKTGSKGEDVKNLQKVLNSDPDTRITNSGAGSPGNETTTFGSLTRAAIQRFQEKYGIAVKGDDGYGEVGPKTRAKLGEI